MELESFGFLSKPFAIEEMWRCRFLDNEVHYRLYKEYCTRAEKRCDDYRDNFRRALKDFFAIRKPTKETQREQAVLHVQWACSLSITYVRILVDILVEYDVQLSLDMRTQFEEASHKLLKDLVGYAMDFMIDTSLIGILFWDREHIRETNALVQSYIPITAPKIPELFDWAENELNLRRMERMSKMTGNQNINVYGTANVTNSGDIYNHWTLGEFQNLGGDLARLRSGLQAQPTSEAKEVVGLLAEAETASNARDQGKVISTLERISQSGWAAIKSVAPQVTSQVILSFLKAHGLA